MEKGIISIIPSDLTIVANAISGNERKINCFCLFKKNNIAVLTKIMNNGSETPNIEFWMILGSKANIVAPTSANFSEKNFLQIK